MVWNSTHWITFKLQQVCYLLLTMQKFFLSQGWPCKKPTNQPKKLWSLLTSLCDSRSWPTAAVLKLLFHEWLWSPLQKAFLLNITEYGVVMWPQMSCFQNWRRNSLAQIWFNPRDVCSRDLQALNSGQGQWLWILTKIIFYIYYCGEKPFCSHFY